MIPLSSDRPLSDPNDDLFGHAPFSKHLADAIRRQKSSDGIVLALYGPWGSGKSTVLGYVLHYLEQVSELDRPVVVPFNPWWFSGQENLARAFLGQLQAVLPEKYGGFKEIGAKLSEFSEALAGAAEVAGGAFGMPIPGGVVKVGLKMLGSKPKDVPGLKKHLSELLLQEAKRVLVVIDDIDRLAPDEVRQLFTVIKALADFPYVTYLLAFDRAVASDAINLQTGLPGERYLEKIIQVPFELPVVDRESLRRALFVRLDAVMQGTPEKRFDNAYWTNVFYSGIDPLIRVPRDIVRLTNSLSVTYPAVVGEVNPVDFIAIESLRVFLPKVYDTIRANAEKFYGHRAPDQSEKQAAVTFHNAWLQSIPIEMQGHTKELLQHLFPKLESVWSNMHYGADSATEWRRHLRVCSPDVFTAYFRLSLPEGSLSRSELDSFLALASEADAISVVLLDLAKNKRSDGLSKARALLERLMDHVEKDVPHGSISPIIHALLDIGDELIQESDEPAGIFDFGNESRVMRVVYHLLKRVKPEQRLAVILSAMNAGKSLRCSQYLIAALNDESEKAAKGEDDALLVPDDVQVLKALWVQKVRHAAQNGQLIQHRKIPYLLSGWRLWGNADEPRDWWQQAAAIDEGLVTLISAFKSQTTSTTFGEYASRIQIRVNPKSIEHYGDVQSIAARLGEMLAVGTIVDDRRPAVEQFILECKMLAEGKNPDGLFAFDN
jgi:predicted KAP-like P-loop ATPase